jgi:hypothetical protein
MRNRYSSVLFLLDRRIKLSSKKNMNHKYLECVHMYSGVWTTRSSLCMYSCSGHTILRSMYLVSKSGTPEYSVHTPYSLTPGYCRINWLTSLTRSISIGPWIHPRLQMQNASWTVRDFLRHDQHKSRLTVTVLTGRHDRFTKNRTNKFNHNKKNRSNQKET